MFSNCQFVNEIYRKFFESGLVIYVCRSFGLGMFEENSSKPGTVEVRTLVYSFLLLISGLERLLCMVSYFMCSILAKSTSVFPIFL
jgi:hypothetical protein